MARSIIAAIFLLMTGAVVAVFFTQSNELSTLKVKLATAEAQIKQHEIDAKVQEDLSKQQLAIIKDALRKKNNMLESQRASADTATDSLLKHIADLNSRIKAGDTTGIDATRTGDVLGECAKEYKRVATEAERMKIKIEGLQEVAKNVCNQRRD